jgi:eukaryotic-like serine/threonine-protein kinase
MPTPPSDSAPNRTLEMAHVLFMDIVAYSRLPMDEQHEVLKHLQEAVRETKEYARAKASDQLIRLPTGDGMALVFFGDAEAPVRCALELHRILRRWPEIQLRMGIHTGPVYRVEDINDARNVAGGGINIAQRVMDCGDAGHILISKSVADVLDQVSTWKTALCDLGEVEVKHGLRIHLYNLCSQEAGNRKLPQKLRAAQATTATARSRAKTKKASLGMVTIGVMAVLVAGGLIYYRHWQQVSKLSDKDTVVLADFDNKTADAIFDDTLKTALSVSLRQSPFLNVLPDRQIARTLQLMTRPTSTKLTPEVTRELCERAGSKAYIAGSIATMGSEYVLGLKAVNCQSGDTLAQEQVTAASKEKVLDALGEAASKMRGELGEALATVQKFDVPPAEATTSSLEALKNYNMGDSIGREKGFERSIPFLKRAIEIDPNFAMAYAGLATKYSDLKRPSLALEYGTKAYELRDRGTEREKLRITEVYFSTTGEIEKEIQTCELWESIYPRDYVPHVNLGVAYASIGQWDKTLSEFQESLRLVPDDVLNYDNLALTYLIVNQLDKAQATFDQASARQLDVGNMESLYFLAFLRGDVSEMERQVALVSGEAEKEDFYLSIQSDTEAYYGRLSKARELSRRAVESAMRADSKESAALWQANAALREAELGNSAAARQGAAAALELSSGRDVKVMAALTLARIGETRWAESLVKELEKSYPTNTLLQVYALPTINAALDVGKGNSSQALLHLEVTAPYELAGAGIIIHYTYLYPPYVRGQAYLLSHNGPAAATEFQKLVDHRGMVRNFVTGALVHLQIGRAYALQGDMAKAKTAYKDFLTLWKDADPDIPILKQAKAEYAKLQ